MNAPLLLLVEDDVYLRRILSRALAARGLVVHEADNLARSRERLAEHGGAFDFAVIDLKLPDGRGLDLLDEFLALNPSAKVVYLSGWGSIAVALEAVKRGAVDFLTKPIEIEDVLRALGLAPEPQLSPAELSVPSLDRVEWEHLQRVLADCQGNLSEAARRLGLHRRSLQRKLAKRPPAR